MTDESKPDTRHTGGCMCGEIRFEVKSAPINSCVCYCVYCRHSAGAISLAWLTLKLEDFVYTHGSPSTYASSPGVVRTFCPKCGTSLTYAHADHKDEIEVTTGSMDNPEMYPPSGIVMPSHRVTWDVPLDLPVLYDNPQMDQSWPDCRPT